jgi:alkaline phosphatase D
MLIQMKHTLFFTLLLLNLSCVTNEPRIETIAFSSCNDPRQGQDILPTLQAALDTIPAYVWLGDNVYLTEDEWASEESALNKYHKIFDQPAYKKLLQTSNHYAIWDDHDAGPNDCDKYFEGMQQTMGAFKRFWKPSYSMPDTNSYYGSTTLGEGAVALFFLDNRSFRVHHDSANATVFGNAQLDWLEQAYTSSTATFKILLMGGQFLSTAQVFDNVSRFPEERDRLIRLLSEDSSVPIVLSGDRHHGELNKLETKNHAILEATASPLTAKSYPHHEEVNETRLHQKTTASNHFGILRMTYENNTPLAVEMRLIGLDGKVLFKWRETY